MNKLSILILSGMFATGAFAQAASTAMPEAQKQGSEKAEAAAEAKHNAKTHGIDATQNSPKRRPPAAAKLKPRNASTWPSRIPARESTDDAGQGCQKALSSFSRRPRRRALSRIHK